MEMKWLPCFLKILRRNKNNATAEFQLEEHLQKIIGLNEVKDFMRSLQDQIRITQTRKNLGLPVDEGIRITHDLHW